MSAKLELYRIETVEYMDDGASQTIAATASDVRQWAADRGIALVPVEPTQQQKHTAESEIANWCSSSRQSRHHQIADRVYRAMVAAAQAQPE